MVFHLSEIEEIIGYKFKDPNLLRNCFIHASYANEHKGEKDFERLEFLGDSVLGFVVSEFLYKKLDVDEGDMTSFKQGLVSKQPLSLATKRLGLDKFIITSDTMQGKITDAICENLFESLIAGIYLDGGIEEAKKFIYNNLIERICKKDNCERKKVQLFNSKNALKEYCEKKKLGNITYETLQKKGSDHSPIFVMAVFLNGEQLAKGEGTSKKSAEQVSAEKALKILKNKKDKRKKQNA